LEADLIESPALQDLSGKAALLVLIRFHQKAHRKSPGKKKRPLQKYVITNNGEIVFSYREARELGIRSTETFYRVCRELTEKGFIDLAEYPNWYEKKPAKWAISDRWRLYGTEDFKPATIGRILPREVGFQRKEKTK
jgi:hypothetical protein